MKSITIKGSCSEVQELHAELKKIFPMLQAITQGSKCVRVPAWQLKTVAEINAHLNANVNEIIL
jgi:aspartate-semialdehyde dehydrogenase